MLKDLIDEVAQRIEGIESRERSRNIQAQKHFLHAVEVLLIDLWKGLNCIPIKESSINLRSGYYSKHQRYRDPLLTYKQTIAAFNGLISLDFVEITKQGYIDRDKKKGALTKFVAKDELLERLLAIDEEPAIVLKPDPKKEIIILRDRVDGQKQEVDYKDTHITERYRDNLTYINNCFLKHWVDLEIRDSEIDTLSSLIQADTDKSPVDLSQRTLVRIFSNGSFKQGGRFYHGWWQNVPSKYRQHITVDMKKTCEYDFSQLNPHMIYFAYNLELGSEDAYDRVFDGEYRDLVKAAFNAMFQASTPLRNCPSDIDPSQADMSWGELRDRIIAAHKPIEHLFFNGYGNQMQFEDSCIAESVMMQFAKIDAPALPIHDSFIMHHGYAGELEEAMRRAFHERFHNDIPRSGGIVSWREADDDSPSRSLGMEEILQGDAEYSKWAARQEVWFNTKK